MPAVLTVSEGATVDPLISVARDFNAAVTYTVTAANGDEQAWTVNTTVAVGDNQPPVAVDDIGVVGLGETVRIDVLANDTDVDTPNAELLIAGVVGVQPENAGSFTQEGREFVFTSSGDYTGDATFGYTVNDGNTGNDDFGQVTVTISAVGSADNDITAFALPGQNTADIDDIAHTVTVNVPDGTLLEAMVPSVLTVSDGATAAPLISVAQDFNTAVTYTVTAANGDEQLWTVNTTVAANQPPVAVENAIGLEIGQTITIDVLGNDTDPDTPVEELVITNVSEVVPAGFGSATIVDRRIEFVSNGPTTEPEIVTFEYTINDGNPGNDATATVTVNITLNEILVTDITIDPSTIEIEVSGTGNLDAIVLPETATNRTVVWSSSDTDVVTVGQTGQLTGIASGNATITGTSSDGSNISATAAVTVTAAQSAFNDITAFALIGQTGQSIIDETAHTVTLEVPFGTELNTVPATFAISDNATVLPSGDSQQDFTGQVEYTVTAENDDVQVWTVNVSVGTDTRSDENDITAFALPGQNESTINDASHTISVNVPDGTPLNVAPGTLAISAGASVDPAVDAIEDFNAQVTYTVTAENEDEQVWTVNVTVSPPAGSAESDITAFELPGQTSSVIDDAAHTVTVEVPSGTELNVVPSVFRVSPNATVEQDISLPQNFGTDVEYTVIAENSSPQIWTIITNEAANQPPIAVDDETGLEVGETINIDVLGNDTDSDTPASELTITSITNVAPIGYGTATINGRQIEFVSNGPPGEPEIVTFDYTINDGNPGNDATATVTVNITLNVVSVTGVSVSPTSITITDGDNTTLTPTITPGNATNTSVTWTTSNPSVATVVGGLVTGQSPGTATITVTTADGGFTATAIITVEAENFPVTGVSVSPTSITITDGDNTTLTPTITPGNATNTSVTWTTSNPSVATVVGGLVTGQSPGTATITVTTADGGFTATAIITVEAENFPVTGVSVSPTSITITDGDNTTLNPTITPGNATNTSVTWTTSNPSVATVVGGVSHRPIAWNGYHNGDDRRWRFHRYRLSSPLEAENFPVTVSAFHRPASR